MRLPPKLKSELERIAHQEARNLSTTIIVLLAEAIHQRKSKESFLVSEYTEGWPESPSNKRKEKLRSLVEEIKLELDDQKP